MRLQREVNQNGRIERVKNGSEKKKSMDTRVRPLAVITPRKKNCQYVRESGVVFLSFSFSFR